MNGISIEALREASPALRARPEDELLGGLAATVQHWRSRYLDADVERLASRTGMAADMLRVGLRRLADAHHAGGLRTWLQQARREAKVGPSAAGPGVVLQILAGNVAGLAIAATIEALLARSCLILKLSTGESVTGASFVRSLNEVAPDLAPAVALAAWTGGDVAAEADALAGSDLVVATGEQATLDAIRSRRDGPMLTYGPRYAAGVVSGGSQERGDAWWDEITREIVLWEQRGCLSPRILFVVGGDPEGVAARVASALARREAKWPAPRPDEGAAASVHQARSRWEMLDPSAGGLMTPGSTSWTVVWDRTPSLDAGPPARFVRVTGVERAEVLLSLIAGAGEVVQGVGYEDSPMVPVAGLRGLRLPRLCPLASIQDPPAGWRADGRSGLAELLQRGGAGAP